MARGVYRRGAWTQLASSLAQGGEFHPQGGKNSPYIWVIRLIIDDCIVSGCHYMRFLGSKFIRNALAAGAPPRTPLGELKRSPDPLADFRGRALHGRGKGMEGKEGGGQGGERGIGEVS